MAILGRTMKASQHARKPLEDWNPIAACANLFESLGVEACERIVLYAVTDLDWVAANFTVFDVALTANRQVKNHRNLFSAIRATEGVFHPYSMV